MSFNLSAFKVLIKKIFPPTKSVYTVDTNFDGKSDSILIRAFNVVIPFELPKEINIEGTNNDNSENSILSLPDLEHLQIFFNNERIDLPHQLIEKESIQDNLLIYHEGEKFNLSAILEGKLKGRIIKLGDTIDILLKVEENTLKKLTKGKHKFKIESPLFSLELGLFLSDDNFNVRYPPERK